MSLDDLLAGSSTWAVDQNDPKRGFCNIQKILRPRVLYSIGITVLCLVSAYHLPFPEEADTYLCQAHHCLSWFTVFVLWLRHSAQKILHQKWAVHALLQIPLPMLLLSPLGSFSRSFFGSSRGTGHAGDCGFWDHRVQGTTSLLFFSSWRLLSDFRANAWC